ncbi:type 2 lanthipeptide synthetase LanM [Enterococcus sp. 5H]|uniref:type 2 lanthipeptide synthetase LanM n=1 Tax=Enterococcus sp. 5H TaxID=1229490 RepID=UPI002303AD36|nr:type 2 lanthipeptide synthetase LanM [Enterococcus sp. 5H]MDA9471760.1 Lanthionine biosynthesis protein LanM [Enterococcus sp. 5H]
MSDDLTYSYATTISERTQCWENQETNEDEQLYFKQWQARKSLLKPDDYTKIFQYSQWDESLFSRGLLPFTEERAEQLLPIIEESEWFQLHKHLFISEIPIQKLELAAALRFHLNYYEEYLRKLTQQFPSIQLTEQVICQLTTQLSDELLFIAQKTLVGDVHQMIEEYHLQAETKEQEFNNYIKEFLGDKQRTYLFFGEYPALARVLATRLMFACEMIEAFIYSLNQSSNQLAHEFGLITPLILDQVKLGQGDSHNHGKTVIQFQIQETKLIFKFKNLDIGERFNKLLGYVEKLAPKLSFYKIKRITFPDFTIEEKVPYKECTTIAEITNFYENYGQLLAIVYWLGATDLHMENLIASGSYPVLIDVETLIRPNMFKQSQKLSRQVRIEKESVIVSGLLPQKEQWKRDLDGDALSGAKQKLPKKVRKLKNEKSSDIAFQLEEGYMEGAQNIPYFAGEAVDYRLYSSVIEQAFKDMNQLLLKNKQQFIKKFEELFANTTIRLIYRDTQDYGNLLNFTLHTDSMSNYIEREKIIENLWASRNIPEVLIPFEIEAMLDHDVPLFTANTSLTQVYTNGHEILNLLERTPLQETVKHMEKITQTTSNFSYLLLKESLGTLEYSLQEIEVPAKNELLESTLLQKAADIGDQVIGQLAVDTDLNVLNWMSVFPQPNGKIVINYPGTDLYGGSAGLYLFFIYLNYFVPKKSYQEIIHLLEKELFLAEINTEEDQYESAFFGEGMRITTAYFVTRLLGDDKHFHYLVTNLKELKNKVSLNKMHINEWLYGKASLLAILAEVYERFENKDAYDLLLYYTQEIDLQKMDDNSFAHGYAGVLNGLVRANNILEDEIISEKILWYKDQFERLLEEEGFLNDSWCRGLIGIEETAAQLSDPLLNRIIQKNKTETTIDDCLCHGNYGIADNSLNNINVLIKNTINLKSDSANISVSLFCGLSGVGYQILRAYNSTMVPSVLFIK